jgi:hypothetical protein
MHYIQDHPARVRADRGGYKNPPSAPPAIPPIIITPFNKQIPNPAIDPRSTRRDRPSCRRAGPTCASSVGAGLRRSLLAYIHLVWCLSRAPEFPMIWPLGACPMRLDDMNDEAPDNHDENAPVQEARVWQDNGWTARVIKNEDDDGWAVAMYKDGESEPALVGPWTMGRDKKNPKPLDVNAFNTLVKTAYEVLRRHEQQLHAQLHKSTVVWSEGGELKITLDIVPDEEHPYALLAAIDEMGEQVAQVRVDAGFKLSPSSAHDLGGERFPRTRAKNLFTRHFRPGARLSC